ncbi:MAG: glycosyltransferase family 87 protein [Pseudomonadota bacterium]
MTLSMRDAAITLILSALFVGGLLHQSWDRVGTDISAIYLGAWLVSQGQSELIYSAYPYFIGDAVHPGWAEAARAAGFGTREVVAYVYPPIWAALLAPLAAALSPAAFSNLVSLVTLSAYAASVFATWRLMGATLRLPLYTMAILAFSLLSLPFLFAWALIQPQLIVIALTLWSFERLERGHGITAGLLLGLAAALKVTPILFLILFLGERAWKASAVALGTAGGVALLSVVVMGWPSHAAFLEATSFISAYTLLYGGNLTFGALAHAFFAADGMQIFPPGRAYFETVTWIGALSHAMLLGGGCAVLWATRALADDVRLPLRAALLFPLLTFFSPLAWSHYYVPVILMALALYGRIPTGPWAVATVASAAMAFAPIGRALSQTVSEAPLLQVYMASMLVVAWAALMIAARALQGHSAAMRIAGMSSSAVLRNSTTGTPSGNARP